jgi:hypothetical protein
MEINKINIVGAILSVIILSICCLVFIFRLLGHQKVEYWLGVILILMIIPLTVLLFTSPQYQRPPIYYIQIGIMIAFLIIELFFDYIYMLEFRKLTSITVIYLVFFFGGTGGMIGIATVAGRVWMIAAIVLFLIMTTLAFVQRAITGM